MINKIIFWTTISFFILVALYLVSNILAPFLIAFICAYLLQPLIDTYCRKLSARRSIATFVVFNLFLSGFVILIVLILPIIYQQILIFIEKIPHYQNNFREIIMIWSAKLHNIDPNLADKVASAAQNFINSIFNIFGSFANHIWHYTLATINFFAILFLVPIILYYFLRDWKKITANLESLLPVRDKSSIRGFISSVNLLLSGYIRGQLNICLMLATYYIFGLTCIGLDLALLLGLVSGFLIIIPFIGGLISFALVMISCYFSFDTNIELLYVLILFMFGHTVEGYILAPKIIGDKIGLHPVWIIFAAFAGGHLFGIIGIIFAIPTAGIIQIILKSLLDCYKTSEIYNN